MQSNNLTPPSSASSSSSLSTSSSSSSICANTSSSKKYHYNERNLPNPKRKTSSSGYHHNSNNYQSFSNKQAQHIKPLYTEYLNSKCAVYVYFKGDILSAIDDHFKKSFSLKTKVSLSSPVSPSSSSSLNTTKSNSPQTGHHIYSSNSNDLNNKEDYYWSNSNTNAPRQTVAAAVAASLTNYLVPNFATDCNQITQEIWPYYQPQHGSFYDNSYQSNGTLIGNNVGQNCWNRNVSSSITNNNCYNNYYEQQSKMTSQSAKSLNGKELNIKEEPITSFNHFENANDHLYSSQASASYSNLPIMMDNFSNSYLATNRYSSQYFDTNKQDIQNVKNKSNDNYMQYSGFDPTHLDSTTLATSSSTNSSLRDTTAAAYAAVYNY